MTTANLLARLRTLLDESSASYWTDTECYQALSDGQSAVTNIALSVYRAKKMMLANEDVKLPYILNELYQERSGTLGTGQTTLVWNTTAIGQVSTAVVNDGGTTGYVAGDLIQVSGAGGHNCILQVQTVSGGAVLTFSIVYGGTGYSTATGISTTKITGSGDNTFTVDVTSVTPSNSVLELIWITYNAAGSTPLYPVRFRHESSGGKFQKTNSYLTTVSTDYYATFSNNNTIVFETASTSNSATWNAGVIPVLTDIDASHNPSLPDITLESVAQFAFAKLLSKDQRDDESKSAFQKFLQLSQTLVTL